MFKEQKVAQMAAFFLDKGGNEMPHLKLMKLLYLADRESLNRHGFSISEDCMVSMPHGPVLSRTLDYINGNGSSESAEDGWESWISDKEDYKVSLKRTFDLETLDELSKADIDVLERVWLDFGHMDKFEIRDYTHERCHEWKDPDGSSRSISFKDVFVALGNENERAKELSERIAEQEELDRLIADV